MRVSQAIEYLYLDILRKQVLLVSCEPIWNVMILSIDQGTTGTTIFIFNIGGEVVATAAYEFTQIYPKPSWVEHDPEEIWAVTLDTIEQALYKAGIVASDLSCIGITNQRETTVLWDKTTGKPVYNAIVWQCRRSSDICQSIKRDKKDSWFHSKTGLVLDAYFSATKIKWIFDQHPEIKDLADKGNIAFGTIDSWLIWKLTGGNNHLTDHTNASRTMLYNIHDKCWDLELLEYLSIPESILPKIQNSASSFGTTKDEHFFVADIPITGVAGDQQSALFGLQCTSIGDVKNTYGTGCFLLMFIGDVLNVDIVNDATSGLLTTIACDKKGKPAYAFEGSVFNAGAAIQWLRDELKIIKQASETEAIALSIEDTKGVYVVPAFTGLGAPYWDMHARGTITGLTRGSGRKEIIRATLESIAFQTKDVVDLLVQQSGINVDSIKVDGGACRNNFLMQFQSDLLDLPIHRPDQIESTAIGAALLAGIGANIWDADNLPTCLTAGDVVFNAKMDRQTRREKLTEWHNAVKRTLSEENAIL